MKRVPYKIHLLNFIVKYSLFQIIFIIFNNLDLMLINYLLIFLIPLFYTVIGIIADWVIVPKYHNIPSSIMGSVFMGSFIYILLNYLNLGSITLINTFILAIFLGLVEIVLHYYFVKPFLEHS